MNHENISELTASLYNILSHLSLGIRQSDILDSINTLIPTNQKEHDLVDSNELLLFLNPESWSLNKDSEQMSLLWISAVLASHFLYKKVNPGIFTIFLKAITYNGLPFLFDYFDDINTKEYSEKQIFQLYKAIAKLHKSRGKIKEAQENYMKAIAVSYKSNNVEQFAYSLSLQAKLYSDYLQRKGLCLAFNKIAFNKIEPFVDYSVKIPTSIQICIDSYAKEIYAIDKNIGYNLFNSLLQNSYLKQDKNRYNRIKYRFLESQIWIFIRSNNFNDKERNKYFVKLLKSYDALLRKTEDNPKALYIRNLHMLSIYRELKFNYKDSYKVLFIKNKIDDLSDKTAIYIIEECINQSELFSDLKFVAKAYFEYSFWISSPDKNTEVTLWKRIEILKLGLAVFTNIDNFSIINEIYIEIVERLANLYVQLHQWNDALYYYSELYNYLLFLTSQLEVDREIIESFINKEVNQEFIDFEKPYLYLESEELHLAKESLLLDYKSLTGKLLEYSLNIRQIQKISSESYEELFKKYTDSNTHDIKDIVIGLKRMLNNFERNFSDHPSRIELSDFFLNAKNEIDKAISYISLSSLHTEDKIFEPKKVNITKDLGDYITFIQKHSPGNVQITFKYSRIINAKLHSLILFRVINNLIENIVYVGNKNSIKKVIIDIGLFIENNFVFLTMTDNCRDYKLFYSIISDLNLNKTIISTKNGSGSGDGLRNIKRLLPKHNWELTKPNLNKKCLKIPLLLESEIEPYG